MLNFDNRFIRCRTVGQAKAINSGGLGGHIRSGALYKTLVGLLNLWRVAARTHPQNALPLRSLNWELTQIL